MIKKQRYSVVLKNWMSLRKARDSGFRYVKLLQMCAEAVWGLSRNTDKVPYFGQFLPCSVSVTGDKGEKDNKQESVIEDWTEREVLTVVKSRTRKLILVAEDIQSNYLLISASLQKDYDLIRAVNGKEAVEICTNGTRDRFGIDGYEDA